MGAKQRVRGSFMEEGTIELSYTTYVSRGQPCQGVHGEGSKEEGTQGRGCSLSKAKELRNSKMCLNNWDRETPK